jgi:hypothetical protein
MLAVKRIHLINQTNAKRLVFGAGAGRACRHQRRECDARRNALKRSHDHPPALRGAHTELFQAVEEIAPTVINLN